MLNFERIFDSIPFILNGIPVTLFYSTISFIFGCIIGCILCFIKVFRVPFLKYCVSFYVSIFRGTPLILQLGITYFGIKPMLFSDMTVWQVGLLCFSLNSSAYISEILYGAFASIPSSQIDVCKVLNIGKFMMFRDILLPQAIKISIFSLLNEVVDLVKESAVISTISEMDVMRRAYIVAANHYLYFEPLLVAGAIYYCLVYIMSFLTKKVAQCCV